MTAEPDDRAHRSPVAADTLKRAAAARPHNPSSMYRLNVPEVPMVMALT